MLVPAEDAKGLDRVSFLMVNKITTGRDQRTHAVIGGQARGTLVEVESRLPVHLGFGARLAPLAAVRRLSVGRISRPTASKSGTAACTEGQPPLDGRLATRDPNASSFETGWLRTIANGACSLRSAPRQPH